MPLGDRPIVNVLGEAVSADVVEPDEEIGAMLRVVLSRERLSLRLRAVLVLLLSLVLGVEVEVEPELVPVAAAEGLSLSREDDGCCD